MVHKDVSVVIPIIVGSSVFPGSPPLPPHRNQLTSSEERRLYTLRPSCLIFKMLLTLSGRSWFCWTVDETSSAHFDQRQAVCIFTPGHSFKHIKLSTVHSIMLHFGRDCAIFLQSVKSAGFHVLMTTRLSLCDGVGLLLANKRAEWLSRGRGIEKTKSLH